MEQEKRSICILSFSPIYRDARVLRQIKYLSPHYDLTIIGYGQPHPDWVKILNIKWISLDSGEGPFAGMGDLRQRFIERFQDTLLIKFVRPFIRKSMLFASLSILFLGRLSGFFYNFWYWRYWKRGENLKVFDQVIKGCFDAVHANDWDTLPVAAEVVKKTNAKLIFDAHEYAPLDFKKNWYWKIFFQATIKYLLKKYASQVTASTTVAPLISQRYKVEFDLNPIVVLNAPESEHLKFRNINTNDLKLIYHGVANKERKLERMIESLKFCDQRFSLHFMLTNNDSNYTKQLKTLANGLTPGRVAFHEPVSPEKIISTISEYDIGFCLIAPTNFNYLVCLPNKFFDYIMAGLPVCVGPSPSMVEFIKKYGFGCVAPSFEPQDVAKVLNQLTFGDLVAMRQASSKAIEEINAHKEMGKLVSLYSRLFDSRS